MSGVQRCVLCGEGGESGDDGPSIWTLRTERSSSACMSVVVRLRASVTSCVLVCSASSPLETIQITCVSAFMRQLSLSMENHPTSVRLGSAFWLAKAGVWTSPWVEREARSSCRRLREAAVIARLEVTKASRYAARRLIRISRLDGTYRLASSPVIVLIEPVARLERR